MSDAHVVDRLSEYLNGELPAAESSRVSEHVLKCRQCREELEVMRVGAAAAHELPAHRAPDGLWEKLEARLESPPQPAAAVPARGRWLRPWALAAGVLLAVLSFWLVSPVLKDPGITGRDARATLVVGLQGIPNLENVPVTETLPFRTGQTLVTDAASRARVEIRRIGEVDVAPSSRVRLLESEPGEHRLALDLGSIEARILAPPRLFFVQTPGALAVDLGCAYLLDVDEAGDGLLQVTSGWVGLERGEREVLVPAGASCRIDRERGPGFPYLADASPAFLESLFQLEVDSSTVQPDRLLAQARRQDVLSLWYVLAEAPSTARSALLDGMLELSPAPAGVSVEALRRLEPGELLEYRDQLEEIVAARTLK